MPRKLDYVLRDITLILQCEDDWIVLVLQLGDFNINLMRIAFYHHG